VHVGEYIRCVANRLPVPPPIPNVVDAAGALKPNALLAVQAAGWPNIEGVEPSPVPNPAPVPKPVDPVAPKAGVVDVVAVLPNPPNAEHEKSNFTTTWYYQFSYYSIFLSSTGVSDISQTAPVLSNLIPIHFYPRYGSLLSKRWISNYLHDL